MATTEHTINDALAAALRRTRHTWRESANVVSSENTGMLKGNAARPDILVVEPFTSPVAVETEVIPAISVETEARSRLGTSLRKTGRKMLSAVAVRLPVKFRSLSGSRLEQALAEAEDLDFAVYTGKSPEAVSRWPEVGWMRGGVGDLSVLIQSASVPPDVVEEAADQLVAGVSEGAGLLDEIAKTHPGADKKISEALKQEGGDQTRRMAVTILANAFVFQDTLAGGPGGLAQVRSLQELRGRKGGLNGASVLAEWRKILEVNYWPIFDIARRILEVIPSDSTRVLAERLAETAERLLSNRLMRSHDLTGAVFQRLIIDRKFLAAYYTTPASASLLLGLAISPSRTPAGGSWDNPEDVKAVRVADFACGTGTLLSTAYLRMGQLHELHGGDSESIHPSMMGDVLVGCDVLPAAAHLTAAMLSGMHPTTRYERSSVFTLTYGRQSDGSIALGSLDLLSAQGKLTIVDITATAKALEGMGEAERELWSHIRHSSFDLVVMNPPFTRPTGHEGQKIGVPIPMFAAFDSTDEEQRTMSEATKKLAKGTCWHGNAGEASLFLELADRKLKPSGTLALVMPMTLMTGDAWEAARALLRKKYGRLILTTISGADDAVLSFSADTAMGECLIIGEKTAEGSGRAVFVVLRQRPQSGLLGTSTAAEIRRAIAAGGVHQLEEGPVGGTQLQVGNQVVGELLDAPLPEEGGWNVARVADLSLAQASYQLATMGRLWLPGMARGDAVPLKMARVSQVGSVGPYHMDVNGRTPNGGVRGPFDVIPVGPGRVPTYPVFWAHDAVRERAMSYDAESEGLMRKGKTAEEHKAVESKAAAVWASASHCHFNRDFRFNSQSTAMQFSPRRSIGGRAWLSISLPSEECEKVLVLWGNTSLGLLMYWWHANKQQAGRGSIGKETLGDLAVLDVTALTSAQLQAGVRLFDSFAKRELRPVNEVGRDEVRAELDAKFASGVIGAKGLEDILAILRSKLASEPSVRGSKRMPGSGEPDDGEE